MAMDSGQIISRLRNLTICSTAALAAVVAWYGWSPAGGQTTEPMAQLENRESPSPLDDNAAASRPQRPTWVQVIDARGESVAVELCQARCMVGVDCGMCQPGGEARWDARRPIPWETFSQGEYIGPYRDVHVPEYRLRVDDSLEFIYRLTRIESSGPYELNVGDQIRVESLIDPNLDRDLVIQPDGSVTLRMLGQVLRSETHRGRTSFGPRGTLQEVLQSAGNHRDPASSQHEAGRLASFGGQPLRQYGGPGARSRESLRKGRFSCRPLVRFQPRGFPSTS